MRRAAPQAQPLNGHRDAGESAAVPVLALRLQAAAKAIGVSDRTLWTWTDAGLVPHLRIGSTVLYPVDVLREWLWEKSRAVEPVASDQPDDAGPPAETGAE